MSNHRNRRKSVPILALGAFLALTPSAKAAAPTLIPGLTPVVLNPLWRIRFGTDYATTASPAEREAHGSDGALYYIAAAPTDYLKKALPAKPLYRLVDSSGAFMDHMDSLTAGEGGYSTEGALGYAFSSATAFPGLAPIARAYDTQPGTAGYGDHTLVTSANSTHAAESLPGYHIEGTMGYGYPRALNANTALIPVSGGGVTVNSNANTGGAVWEWNWNGIEFINDYDYGRQLSTAVYAGSSVLEEAGDGFSEQTSPVYARHAAPTLSVTTSGSNQSSFAIPIDWSPQTFGGGPENPVIYPTAKIGKNLSLNWIGPDGVNRNWPLAQYQSVYEGPALPSASVEAPTAYVDSTFHNYYKYEPVTDTLVPVTCYHTSLDISGGVPAGVILANGTDPTSLAMGAYMSDPNAGLVIYDQSGPDNGEYGSSLAKWGVVFNGPVQSTWTFRTWIATDTVQNLKAYFRQLYLWGVASRDHTHDNPTMTYDPVFYLYVQPDLGAAFGPAANAFQEASVHWYAQGLPLEGRRGSPQFDVQYYLKYSPDLMAAFGPTKDYQGALNHFLSTGLPTEGRRASLEFDVRYYLAHNPDVAAAYGATNYQAAANHWLSSGLSEGRQGSADFSAAKYLARYADLRAAYGPKGYYNALIHWVSTGRAEGRIGN